jgi:hypothetical protein
MKFFLKRQAFDVEHALYRRGNGAQAGDLTQFLPQVRVFSFAMRHHCLMDMCPNRPLLVPQHCWTMKWCRSNAVDVSEASCMAPL